MEDQTLDKIIEHQLGIEPYIPLIQESMTDLDVHFKNIAQQFPRTTEVFQKIMKNEKNKSLLLEDFLIIIPFQFIWTENKKALSWFENLFNSFSTKYPNEWKQWLKEIVEQTNSGLPLAICNQIYSYLLHFEAAVWAQTLGCNLSFSPYENKGADILVHNNDQKYAIECKFIHTSQKFESCCSRIISAFRCAKKIPIMSVSQFQFPSSQKLKSLKTGQYCAVKEFVIKISKNHESSHCGLFNDIVFEYHYHLRNTLVTIDAQQEYARENALEFLHKNLSKTLQKAAEQLACHKDHKKILFIGLQPDMDYLIEWNEEAITEIKEQFRQQALNAHQIKVIFSEEAGCPVDRYL